jgi:chitinase
MLIAYAPGDRVEHGGAIYECQAFPASGWCGLDANYEPGVGIAWEDAWTLIGPC